MKNTFDSNTLAANSGKLATFVFEGSAKLNVKNRVTKERGRWQNGQVAKHSRLVGRLMTQERLAKRLGEFNAGKVAEGVEVKESAPRFEWVGVGVVRSLSSGKLQWAIDPTGAKRSSAYFADGEEIVGADLEELKHQLAVPSKSAPMVLTVNQATVANAILPDGIA